MWMIFANNLGMGMGMGLIASSLITKIVFVPFVIYSVCIFFLYLVNCGNKNETFVTWDWGGPK